MSKNNLFISTGSAPWSSEESVERLSQAEAGQAKIRLLFMGAIWAFIFWLGYSGRVLWADLQLVFWIIGAVTANSAFWVWLTKNTPATKKRVMFATVVDACSIVSASLACPGPETLIWTFFFLWVPIGNALRFGPFAFMSSYCSSLFALALLWLFKPEFAGPIALGVVLGAITGPIYAHKLASRLDEALQRLAKMATQDALTGLANRRVFMECLDWALDKSKKTKEPLACLYLDLDGFKQINDNEGHEAGDKLLSDVGKGLKEIAEQENVLIAARLGGDEFAFLLAGRESSSRRFEFAEKINQAVRKAKAPSGKSAEASVGMKMHDPIADIPLEAKELLSMADQEMYLVKGKKKATRS